MSKFPLHYQIFIALVLGTIVGVFANPGEVLLDDTQREEIRDASPVSIDVTDRRLHMVDAGKTITVTYTRREDGRMMVNTFKFAGADELAEQFPEWHRIYEEHVRGLSRTITVTAKWLGDMFLRLLKMITIPLIVTSLVSGVAGLGETSRFGSMFAKTMLYYLVTSLLAITTGLIMVNLVQPGHSATLPGGGEGTLAGAGTSLTDVFTGLAESMVPTNPVQALASGNFLSIITFSILLGVFIIFTGGKSAETMRQFFRSAFEVMMRMTLFIIRLAPIGVFAFMTFATASQGLEIFKTLGWYMLTVFLALVVHAFVILPLILKFVARRSPLEFARAMSPALMTAVSTASSNGTLPLTLTCVEERAGVDNRISSFVLPLGATINMDGTALYEAVAVLFIAQATASMDPNFTLTLGTQITVAFTALLASIGAAGIPHAGLVMMAIVLQAVGLPLEAQGIIIAVDRVLDMCRTSVNVWSDSCGCAVLARFERSDETG
jgi:Na+/H+-dicarboxylate symporter